MPRNRKLTKGIAGRIVKAATTEPGSVLVLFDDQSNMKIKTAGTAMLSLGGKVKSVHETKVEFKIEFEDGSIATLCLADPLVRCRPRQKIMRWNTSGKSDH
jgi:hypothetical protein